MSELRELRRLARESEQAAARRALGDIRPRGRLDAGLVALTLGGVTAASLAGYAIASFLAGSSLLDPPLPAEIDDPRILSDYRQPEAPIVDAVARGRALVMGREDGTITVFDTLTRRFDTETLPGQAKGLSGPLSLLSQGCTPAPGAPWQSCAQSSVVHALTATGGLARSTGADWRVLLEDSRFTGADGQPVQQADVQDWIAADDGSGMLVDAGEKGLGLFREADGHWTALPAVPGTGHVLATWRNRYFIGSSAGLFELDSDATGPAQRLDALPGAVLSLDRPGEGGPVALLRHACAEGGAPGCLTLARLGTGKEIRILRSETALFPQLNDSGLHHAVAQAGQLITLGAAGLHLYDPAERRWQELDGRPPTAHFAETEGIRLHAGFPDRFVTLEKGRIVTERKLDDPLRQIIVTAPGVVWGLDRAGRILRLDKEAEATPPRAPGFPAGATFLAAAALGDRLVALGRDGIFVHDIRTRGYAFVAASDYPALPLDAPQLVASAGQLWLVDRQQGEIRTITLSGELPALRAEVTEAAFLGTRLRLAHPDGGGLAVITGQGTVYFLSPPVPDQAGAPSASRVTQLTQQGLPAPIRPVSMAASDTALILATGNALWGYDIKARGWKGPWPGPQGSALRDVALTSDQILALDDRGRLFRGEGQGWQPVIGAPVAAELSGAEVGDAMSDGRTLFLAGNGKVQSYRPQDRSFGQIWTVPGAGGDTSLLSVAGGVPLWRTGNGLFRGAVALMSGAGFEGGWRDADGPVVMARENGRRYLQTPAGCLFRGAAPPEGDLRGVVPLPDGRLIVATSRGAGLYEPQRHRWLQVRGLDLPADAQLRVITGQLVQIGPDHLRSLPLATMSAPDSCQTEAVQLTWRVTLDGIHPTLVEERGEVLFLDPDGALRQWSGGSIQVLAPAPGPGPAMAQVRKAYAVAESFELLTDDALWSYDLRQRLWQKRPFRGQPRSIVQIDRVSGARGPVVSAWDDNGALWVGTLSRDGIAFEPASRPAFPKLPFDPARLRDLAQTPSAYLALSDRQLALFQRGETAPFASYALPAAARGWTLQTLPGGQILLSDGPPERPAAFHVLENQPEGAQPLAKVAWRYEPGTDRAFRFGARGGAAALWRIDAQLALWHCTGKPTRHAPDCSRAAPPPLVLDAGDLWGAVTLPTGPGQIVQTARGLIVLDPALRPIRRLDGPRVTREGQLFMQEGTALFWEGKGGALWHLAPEAPQRMLARVDHLHRRDGQLLTYSGNSIRLIGAAGSLPPPVPAALAKAPIALAHPGSVEDTFLTADGRAFAARGARFSDPLIRFPADLAALIGLETGPGEQADWLGLTAEGQLIRYGTSRCEIPPPAPPAPPPDFIGPMPHVPPPPPRFAPCESATPLALRLAPGEVLVDALAARGRITVVTDRRRVELDRPGGRILSETALPGPDLTRPEDRNEIARQLRDVDGRSYLNPPDLAGAALRGLVPGRSEPLAPLDTPEPLDKGWVAWDRALRAIVLQQAGAAEPLRLPPEQAMPQGVLLPLQPGRGIALAAGDIAWMTGNGLWQDDPLRGMRRVSAQGMAQPLAMYEGAFLDGTAQIDARNGTQGPAAQTVSLQNGAYELTITPRAQRLAATLLVDGQKVDDLDRRGFLHDRRTSVGSAAGGPVYLTPLGLVPAERLDGASAAPIGAQRIANEGGALKLQTPGGWVAPQGGQWAGTPAPFRDRVLARENGRRWQVVKGVIGVTTEDPAQGWRIAGRGLDFEIDQLLGFAATPETAVAVTGAGTFDAARVSELAGVRPPQAPAPGGPLDAMRHAPDLWRVHAATPAGPVIWDRAGARWRAPDATEQGWTSRLVAQLEGIEVGFAATRPRYSIAVQRVGVGPDRLPFDWQRGAAMPFDQVLSLVAEPGADAVLAGTRMGLRLLSPRGPLANRALLVPAAGGIAATRAGRPATDPGRVQIAFEGGGCLEATGPLSQLTSCARPADLSNLLVRDTGFWRWRKQAGGVSGAYLLEDGREMPIAQPLAGALPHDTLNDRLSCAGETVELWRDSPVVRRGNRLTALEDADRLWCQDRAAAVGNGVTLAPGTYAVSDLSATRLDRAGAAPVRLDPARGAALRDRLSGRVTAEAGRLRYGLDPEGRPDAALLTLDDRWRDLAWTTGRLALDTPLALAAEGGALQFVTADGVAGAATGRIDPATLVTAETADPAVLARCAPRAVRLRNGLQHAEPARPAAPLWLSCADGSALEGRADGHRDLGALAPAAPETDDPVPLAAVTGDLSASRTRTSGTVALRFRGEPARLTAGRFDFDTFRAIALPFPDRIETLTASGWWRLDANAPGLAATRRPGAGFDAAKVSLLTHARWPGADDAGASALCLRQADGKALLWDGARGRQAAETCDADRGQSGPWRLSRRAEAAASAGSAAGAEAVALNGLPLTRALIAGGFTDLRLRGAAQGDPAETLLIPSDLGVLAYRAGHPVGSWRLAPGGVLLPTRSGDMAYVDRDGAYLLAGAGERIEAGALVCPALPELMASLPEGVSVLRADPAAPGMVRLRLDAAEGRQTALMFCDDASRRQVWTELNSVADHPRSRAMGAEAPDWLAVSVTDSRLLLRSGPPDSRLRSPEERSIGLPQAPLTGGLRAMLTVPSAGTVYLVTARAVWEVPLGAAITLAAQAPVAPPPAAPGTTPVPGLAPVPGTAPVPGAAPLTVPPQVPAASVPRLAPVSAVDAAGEPAFDVRAVQRALRDRVDPGLGVDGILGPQSRRAIGQWQSRTHADPTGYLGPDQLHLLLEQTP